MKKILITGANSYIGTSFENYIKQWPEEYQVDIIDTKGLEPSPEIFNGYNIIFHVAGIAHVKEIKENKELYFKVNRDLTIAIARCARKAGVEQFIALSSMSVYGRSVGQIDKKTRPEPNNAYGRSKYEADIALLKEDSENFKVSILRPPMVYGKGCKGNYQVLRKFTLLVPIFPNYINKRSMIYIGNLCEFVKRIMDDEKKGVFFPQNAQYVCTSEMVKLIAKENGKIQVQTSFFNPLIKILPLNILNKIFGDLVYEKDDVVDKFGFIESIKLSEEKDEK